MIIHNPILTGSFTVNGTDVSSITSSAASITALNSYTASQNILNGTYATTGSNTFAGIQTVNSNLVVTGSITAATLVVQTITSSVVYSSGSNVFGNDIANTQVFTGSLQTTGSNTFSGYSIFSSSINEVARFKSSNANGMYITFESSSAIIGDIGNSSEVFNGASTLDFGINARGNRKLQLGSFQTITLTITGSNVGIGTSSPLRLLDVSSGGDTYLRVTGNRGNSDDLHVSNIEFYNSNSTRIIAEVRAITGTGGTQSNSGQLAFYTNNAGTYAERMRITSAGNVLIGKTSSTGGVLQVSNGTNMFNVDYDANGPYITAVNNANTVYKRLTIDASEILFDISAAEKMRITSGGIIQVGNRNSLQQSYFGYSNSYKTLLIGSTGTDYSTDATTLCFGVDVSGNANGSFSGNGTEYIWRNAGSFKSPNSANNNYNTLLSWNSSGIVTVTTSDYRAKEDLKSFEALPMIEAMKLYDFRWIELQERMHGVLAHELQEIVPYAVIGEKDGGSMQGVDYSKLVPVMLKAIQELQAQITELKNK
jgi:hypothetical protein